MRLRSLELDQFRKFGQPMRLDGLADGVNVLCAPNEFGKSTLLAAIRAVLFERHASRTASIRSYQTRIGGTAPRVALRFEHDGMSHRIEKRFLSRPQAILRSGAAVFEADAAEEQLAGLLGINNASRGARDAASIWDALLVGQGESFDQAILGDTARATLSDCLQFELGAVSGGVAIARLLKPVQVQLAERLDGHGKPRDRFKQALAERENAATELAALDGRKRVLRDDLAALAAARRSLAEASDPDAAAAARDALREARQNRDALLGQRDRVGQATAAVELATREAGALRDERARRAALVAAIAANARTLDRLRDTETGAAQRLADANAALDHGRVRHADAERVADHGAIVLRAARGRQDRLARDARHAHLRERLVEAERLAGGIATLSARLETLAPDDKGILALRQAFLDDRADHAAVLGQATTVEIVLSVPLVLEQLGSPAVIVPAGTQTLELTSPATLRIDGIGAIAIVPAAGDRDRLLAAAQRSARHLRQLLDAAGCADLAEAEKRNAERLRIVPALAEAKRALAALDGGSGIDGLRREADAARPPDTPGDAAISGVEVGPDVETAQSAAGVAQFAERDAREALRGPETVRDAARIALAETENGVRTADAERVQLLASAEQAQEAASDEALADRLGTVERLLSDANTILAALVAAAPEGTVALADARIARLEQAEHNRADAQALERERIAGLDARIAAAEGAGLDEQIELAARRGEDAARTVADNEREVAVLSLLRSTLLDADRSARERFLQPLVGRISPTLRALFPGASVALDERFSVAGLQRPDGGGAVDAEAFDTLSHGTREQVAILCRLAFADMLAARGHPSFLLLDDALAFADAERMDRMFDILHEAGQRLQILVLTCRADAAARLGGHAVRLEPAGETSP